MSGHSLFLCICYKAMSRRKCLSPYSSYLPLGLFPVDLVGPHLPLTANTLTSLLRCKVGRYYVEVGSWEGRNEGPGTRVPVVYQYVRHTTSPRGPTPRSTLTLGRSTIFLWMNLPRGKGLGYSTDLRSSSARTRDGCTGRHG